MLGGVNVFLGCGAKREVGEGETHVLFVSLEMFADCSRDLELSQRPEEPKKPILLKVV